jgi:uncharacterized protein with PIN domain
MATLEIVYHLCPHCWQRIECNPDEPCDTRNRVMVGYRCPKCGEVYWVYELDRRKFQSRVDQALAKNQKPVSTGSP